MQITELILQTSKLDELASFYSSLIELPVVLNDYRAITIQTGSTNLVFKQASVADPFYHFAINHPGE